MGIKALACQLPREAGLPLARYSCGELAALAMRQGLVATISDTTVWRWLSADAIRPWQHRSWILPRDPQFETKAARVLDLYHRSWQGEPLGADDYVLCGDEKTSIQARERPAVLAPTPGAPMRVEHEYIRRGALAYLAAWDVARAKLFGCCEATTGIEPFDRLVAQVMTQEPYRSARRVFWVIDNGSSHRGQACRERWQRAWPNLIAVHLPIHASWLNQIEIYFSVVQRKLLTPNDFGSLAALADALLAFQARYEAVATAFEWRFTRQDLTRLMAKLAVRAQSPALTA